MTLQDTDICLNIAAIPVQRRKRKVEYAKSFKRQKNQKKLNNKESNRNASTQEQDSEKRVKQKLLSTTSNNKKETDTIAENAQTVPSQAEAVTAKVTKPKKIKQSDGTNEKDSKSDKVSSNVSSDAPHESIISFTKTTKEHVGKTLLAKKKDTSKNKQKKSLSDIFSNQSKQSKDQIGSNVPELSQEHNIDKNIESNKESNVSSENKPFLSKETKRIDLYKKNIQKHQAKTNSKESDQIPKLAQRGKVSSLFSHNPDIPIIGQRCVKPVNEPIFTKITFADLNIHSFMISNLEKNMHITKITTIQEKAIPQILSGRDVLIRSQTGSGKTLAYALPIVELLHKIRPKLNRTSGLLALIIVPTRELALQTFELFTKLVQSFLWIVPSYLIGGEKRKTEKARLRKGCNILIATPGRLLDHIQHTETLKLNLVKYFILDEADRMFDMGYEKHISEIISVLKVSNSNDKYNPLKMLKQNLQSCNEMTDSNASNGDEKKQKYDAKKKKKEESEPEAESAEQDCETADQSKRQTILLSATLTHTVEELAGLTMNNPVFVDAVNKNLKATGEDVAEFNEDLIVPQGVTQSYVVIPPKLRMVTLSAYITNRCHLPGQHKILIFMATQDMVDYHTEILSSVLTKPINKDGEDFDPLVDVEFFKLHGNMTQKERTDVFKTFREAKSGVLLCTDVAARGLDMPKIDCVVQYTGPISIRDYVHRIGRTARAGCSGTAMIFLTPPEVKFVRMLESRRIRIQQQDMNLILDKLLMPLPKHCSMQEAAAALQNDFENLLVQNRRLREQACTAYLSWMRFYSSYPREMHEVFDRKELHLGHYAKSFALREPPRQISGIGRKLYEKRNEKSKHDNRLSDKRFNVNLSQKKKANQDNGVKKTGSLKRVKMLNTSEYDSGLEPLKKKSKK